MINQDSLHIIKKYIINDCLYAQKEINYLNNNNKDISMFTLFMNMHKQSFIEHNKTIYNFLNKPYKINDKPIF
jgi:hypothetical protein